MRSQLKQWLFLGAFLMLLIGSKSASANDVYLAQTAQGGNTGADCADALVYTYFNTSGNWTSGTPSGTKIGPGTTVHLCGTFTGSAGVHEFSFQGGGASGNPVTLHFETNAVLTNPYWPGFGGGCPCDGAILVNGKSNIVIDGGTNGIIQNTANGTSLANQQNSAGVTIEGAASNVTVQNLTIQGIYQNGGSSPSATDTAGQWTADILVQPYSGTPSAITIQNNVLNNARTGAWITTSGSSVNVGPGNSFDDHCWQIAAGGTGSINIHGNSIGRASGDFGWLNWQFPSASYHTDGIIANGSLGNQQTLYVYNNLFQGDLGAGSATAFIFLTYGVSGDGSGTAGTVFNNVLDGLGNCATGACASTWLQTNSLSSNPMGPFSFYNNTFVNWGDAQIYWDNFSSGAVTITIENNIGYGCSACNTYFMDNNGGPTTNFTSDYNNWSNGRGFPFSIHSTSYTFSTWKTAGFDTHGSSGNPNLSATNTLQAGSAAIGLGTNLTSLCSGVLVALCSDITGLARPSSGAWDAGAYIAPPSPPTSVVATPH